MRLYLAALLLLVTGISLADSPPSLLFAGTTPALGTQLWQTDNTPQHTKILTYLVNTPNGNAKPYPVGSIGQWGIFAAHTPETGYELWRTDGTPQGTQLLKELVKGAESGMPSSTDFMGTPSIQHKQHLLFWSRTPQTLSLTTTDGTPERTEILKTFPIKAAESALHTDPTFYSLGAYQLFWADDQLWRTDGTATGTQLFIDTTLANHNADYGFYISAMVANNLLYFISPDQNTSYGKPTTQTLWVTDGIKTTKLYTFSADQSIYLLAANEHSLIYTLSNTYGTMPAVWRFDLNQKTTELIYQLPKPSIETADAGITSAHFWYNRLYIWFEFFDQNDSSELWVIDLAAKKSEKLVNLPNPNREYKARPELFNFADQLYFFTKDGVRPNQLWLTDGTTKGTKKLLATAEGYYAGGAGDSWFDIPSAYVMRGDYLIFPTFSEKGREFSKLWSISKSQPTQPMLLGEFADPYLLRPAPNDQGKLLYFISGKQRFQTDGTLAGTKALGNEPLRVDWEPQPWPVSALVNSLALPTNPPSWLVSHQDAKTGIEPWVVTTRPKQTQLLKDINTQPASADLRDLHKTTQGWYFKLGSQLWFSAANTTSAQPINLPANETLKTGIYNSTIYNNHLYFLTHHSDETISLWQADKDKATQLYKIGKGLAFIYPSLGGIYIAHGIPKPDYNYDHELMHWEANKGISTLMPSTTPINPHYLLATPQGLVALLNPIDSTTSNLSLWLDPTDKKQATLLMDGFYFNGLANGVLLPTLNQIYFKHQPMGEATKFYRIDFKHKKLQLLPIQLGSDPTIEINTRSSTLGLFFQVRIQDHEELWFLEENKEQAQPIKVFPAGVNLQLVDTEGDTLYFNVSQNYEYGQGDLWLSQGSATTTQLLKAGVVMEFP